MSLDPDEYLGSAIEEDTPSQKSLPVMYKGKEIGEAFYDQEDETLLSVELDPDAATLIHRGNLKGFSISHFN